MALPVRAPTSNDALRSAATVRSAGQALGFGVVAGMRVATAVAIASRAASRGMISVPPGKPFDVLNSRRTVTLGMWFSMPGEMIADLLPFTPPRTMPAAWLGRVATGSGLGAVVARGGELPLIAGALLGGAGAWLGTLGGYKARQHAGERSGLPDPIFGLLEDAIAVSSATLVVRRPWYGFVLGACAMALAVTLRDADAD